MPLSSLPDECFINVLSFLDRNTLHKCLFVNRYFCKLTIPIIWRNPFKWSCTKGFLLINTLLKCLNEDEISSLIPYGINIDHQSPLFEYEKFIRKFDHCNCAINVIEWLKLVPATVDRDLITQKLINVICHMLMRAGSNLKEFVIFLDFGTFDLPTISIFTTYTPGITNLKSLKVEIINDSLTCQITNTIKFLNTIPKVCNGIIKLKIWIFRASSEIITPILDIIKSQPINNISITSIHNMDNISKIIIHSSKFRSKTLKRLTFDRISFKSIDLLLLSKLRFLEYLKFFYCKSFTIKHCDDLSKKEFHLKGLTWLHHFDDHDLFHVIAMINSLCNETLIELYSNVATIETIKIVKKSCPNINYLRVDIRILWYSMVSLICDLKSLRTLDMRVEIGVNQDLLKFLGDYLIFVKNLSFIFDLYSDDLLNCFDYFTSNCKANLKKLSINLHDNNPLRKDFLKCIDNYQKVHNSLKVLEIKQYEFHWSNEEREIVKSLENQGVFLKHLGESY
ncbi:hypothetical protein RclHR1_06710009 [Rhizophagus clarus]|uniref:F-box domain-containing protein n=1 Tax=Rhizophagus clarus TaxID=94130 RepID=A0A2Z6SJP9_9GLOM|nr:hypothetical protein RclHR1_06710009 [Rhizophagus clarus]GES73182.1 hypothetical protein GLOIN_2v637630 [Rhizophagus clarus]